MGASLIRQTMKVSKETQPDGTTIYVCQTHIDERFLPKATGFEWNPTQKRWQTEKIRTAAKLREFADFTCHDELASITVSLTAGDKIDAAHKEVQKARDESERERVDREARRLAMQCSEEEKRTLLEAVPRGNYIVDIDKKPTILQVSVSAVGNQYLNDKNGNYLGFRANLLRVLASSDLGTAGRRYGTETGRCWRCNRPLTDAISKALGVGPECGADEHTAHASNHN